MRDTASARLLGDRMLQQDSVESFHYDPANLTLLALSDGIGGAGNGQIASRLIVRSAMANLKAHLAEIATGADALSDLLHGAAMAANRTLASTVARQPELAGMGGTLILAVLSPGMVHHLSIGDSLVYRLRGTDLSRLNAVHSLGDGLDNLAAMGRIDARAAQVMAARSTLTSALTGARLGKIDVPVAGVETAPGDVLLLASDGIETLSTDQIAAALADAPQTGAAVAAAGLIRTVEDMAKPGQDNLGLAVTVL